MRYFQKRGLGGAIQIGPLTVNTQEHVVLASIANCAEQRILLDALRVGLSMNGHSLEKLP